jgi:hypothetical protein
MAQVPNGATDLDDGAQALAAAAQHYHRYCSILTAAELAHANSGTEQLATRFSARARTSSRPASRCTACSSRVAGGRPTSRETTTGAAATRWEDACALASEEAWMDDRDLMQPITGRR